jgi:hypothetical protein
VMTAKVKKLSKPVPTLNGHNLGSPECRYGTPVR